MNVHQYGYYPHIYATQPGFLCISVLAQFLGEMSLTLAFESHALNQSLVNFAYRKLNDTQEAYGPKISDLR